MLSHKSCLQCSAYAICGSDFHRYKLPGPTVLAQSLMGILGEVLVKHDGLLLMASLSL